MFIGIIKREQQRHKIIISYNIAYFRFYNGGSMLYMEETYEQSKNMVDEEVGQF